MSLYSATLVEARANGDDVRLTSGQLIRSFHKPDACLGDVCPIHKPTEHGLRSYPLALHMNHMVRILATEHVGDLWGVVIPGVSSDLVGITIDPDDYRYNTFGRAIVRNSGYCLKCFGTVESRSTHHYSVCLCGECFVDGGAEYLRSSASPFFVNTAIVFTRDDED